MQTKQWKKDDKTVTSMSWYW